MIAIRGVDGHDFTKFCSVTDVRLDPLVHLCHYLNYFYCSSSAIEAIQWLKGDEIVETDNVDPLDESHFFISNGAITADMAGHYYCRALIMGDLTDRSSAGQLTVLGERGGNKQPVILKREFGSVVNLIAFIHWALSFPIVFLN